MVTTNPEGRLTRGGFLEGSSAALASAGLIGNLYAANSALSSESMVDSAKPTAVPPAGKIALEEHFVLAETIDTSYALRDLPPETRHKILDVGSGRIAEMDRGGLDICILSLTAPGVQAVPNITQAIAQARRTNDYLAEKLQPLPHGKAVFRFELPWEMAPGSGKLSRNRVGEIDPAFFGGPDLILVRPLPTARRATGPTPSPARVGS